MAEESILSGCVVLIEVSIFIYEYRVALIYHLKAFDAHRVNLAPCILPHLDEMGARYSFPWFSPSLKIQFASRVVNRMTKKVTHVIWKLGRKNISKQIEKQKVRDKFHVVTPLWVERCRQLQKKVTEKEFRADTNTIASGPSYEVRVITLA